MGDFLKKLNQHWQLTLSGLKQARHFRLSSIRRVFSLMGKKEKIALITLLIVATANLFLLLRNFYLNYTLLTPALGGSFSEGLVGQPVYLNPILAQQGPDNALVKLIFSGLYKHDTSGQLVPDLAESLPSISEDQKQYTINLKKNVKWHNNKPFTADDVVFTIQTIKDQSFKSPLRSLWQSTTVEKIDDYRVKLTTKDISGPFIHNLTLPILPRSIWSRVGPSNFLLSKFNLEAIGTGPYAIKEVKKLSSGKIDQITLNSFANYYEQRAKIETVMIKFYDTPEDLLNALHSREVQALGFLPQMHTLYLEEGRTDLQIFKLPLPQYQVLFFNTTAKILSEQGVREALSLSVDKPKIIKEVFKSYALTPSSPLLMTTLPLANSDLKRASEILEAGGWKIDSKINLRSKKNTPLELNFVTNDSWTDSQTAALLAEQWRQLNIKINLSILPTKQLTEKSLRPRNFDILLFPQKFGPDPDPFAFWHSSQTKDPGLNLTGFADPQADKLISEARNTTNPAKRKEKYQILDQLINNKFPVALLNQTIYIYALDSKIRNIHLQSLYEPSERFYDLPNWYVEQTRVWK